LEESNSRLSCRLSLPELTETLKGNMLCFDEDSRHFYTRQGSLSSDLADLIQQALTGLRSSICLSSTPLPDPISAPVITADDDSQDNYVMPLTSWDGLLTAELLLRPNNDHRILDLTKPESRAKMATAIRGMDFLDLHDAHSIAQHLEEFPSGVIPDAPKMSIEEMKAVCLHTDSSFVITKGTNRQQITQGNGETVHYNSDTNRYQLDSALAPSTSLIAKTGSPIVSISWNCNSWDFHKSQKIASLANPMVATL
jgi:hypothetical protein